MFFFFQAEDGIRDSVASRGLGMCIRDSNIAYSKNIDKLYEKIDLLGEVLEKVQDEYVDEIDQAEVMDFAINGILQSLDPYSSYMNPKIFEEMQTETSGEFGGLGIEVSMEGGVVKSLRQ